MRAQRVQLSGQGVQASSLVTRFPKKQVFREGGGCSFQGRGAGMRYCVKAAGAGVRAGGADVRCCVRAVRADKQVFRIHNSARVI